MKKHLFHLFITLAITAGMFVQTAKADIGVTVNNYNTTTPPLASSYTSLALALADLNAVTAMTGPVTLTLTAGTSETAPPTGLTIGSTSLNAVLSATNTVTIVKAGGTVTLNAGIGTATPASAVPDGILKIAGADYITIDGLTFTDGNATNPETMEFGLALFKLSVTDGAQNNTIQNCTFNMQRINNANATAPMVEGSVGILVTNSLPTAATTVLVPTAASGSNSNNKFYTNTTNGGNYGIVLYGYAAATPFTLGDTGNDIGGTSTGQGNTILNYGGAAAATNPAAGIRANYQWGVNISYNTINNNNGSGVNHPLTLRGIYAQAGTSASANINNNQITIKGGALTSAVTAIENAIGSTAASNTININNNTITGEYLTATSGVFYGIYSSSTATNVNINYNSITNLTYSAASLAGSGVLYGIYNSAAAGNVIVDHNMIDGISRTGITGGTMRGIYISSGTTQTITYNTVKNMSISGTGTASIIYGIDATGITTVISKNNVNNINNLKTTGTGSFIGIYDGGSPTNEICDSNTVHSLSNLGTGAMYGIYHTTTTGTRAVSSNTVYGLTSNGNIYGIASASSSPNYFKNKIYNITSTSAATPTVAGFQIAGLGTAGIANIYNNLIGDLKAPNASSSAATSPSIRGINITTTTTSTTLNFHYNTIYLNASSTGTNFGTAGIFVTGSATATTASLNLRNNIIVNNSTPAGTGLTVAYHRTSVDLANYGLLSNNNLFYAGTSGPTRLIMYDGTNSYTTLAAFQTAVGPTREVFSISENPIFVSTTGADNTFLHINTGNATGIESGAANIATYTDDFDGNLRQGNAGYSGTGTAPDIGADEFDGIPFYTCSTPDTGNTASTGNNLCLGQSITLSMQNAITGTGNTFQWQSSPDGIIAYSNIPGANAVTYTVTPTVSLFYQCVVTCQNGPVSVTSNPLQITFSNAITSTTPNSRCGIGTVELAATGGAGTTLNWYSGLLGGIPVGTGSPFITPEISSTTTYYVGAETFSAGNKPVGAGALTLNTYPNPFYSAYSNIHTQHLITAAELAAAGLSAGNITSVALDVTSAGTLPMIDLSVKIAATTANNMSAFVSPVFSSVYTNASFLPSVGLNVLTFSPPFNWDGTSNIVLDFCHGNSASSATMSRTVKSDATSYVSSIKTHILAATAAATICANTTTTLLTYSVRPQFTFAGQVYCSSARSPVVATVTPAPPLAVTPGQSICNNSVAALSVSSNVPDYDSYVWSPVTSLFIDDLCSQPYTGTSNSIVYFKSTTAGINTYTCTANNSSTLCRNITTTVVTNLPGSIVITATPDQHCLSGSSVLTAVPATGYGTAVLQWQNSTDNINFSDITDANSISYTTPTLTGTTYYKLKVNLGSTECTETNVATITVNNPLITGTIPDTRCGPGPVTLEATGSAGSALKWYSVATGGTPLGFDSPFNIPLVSSTTTYYVGANIGTTLSSVGAPNTAISTSLASQTTTTSGINFDVTAGSATIKSVDIYPTPAIGSAFTITVKQGTTVIATYSGVTTVQGTIAAPVAQTVPLNFVIPAGTGYQITAPVNPGIIRNSGGDAFPYAIPGVITLTSSTLSTYFYNFYNWQVETSCESARTPVIATINPAPVLTITGNQALCANLITSMTVTSTVSDYDTYTWSPVTGLYTDALCTIPYVTLEDTPTVYVKIPTHGSYTYTCNAHNSSDDCANIATSVVTVYPAVTAIASATPATVCPGNNSQLIVQPSQFMAVNATDYTFTYSVHSYSEISGGTVLGNTSIDEEVFNNNVAGATGTVTNTGFPIGFNINFGSQTFDKFAVATNGYIVLGTGTFAIGNNLSTALSTATALGFANLISVFNNDLQGQTGSELSYLTTGSAGSRVLTIQWKGFRPYLNTADNMNFQIQLYEGTNVVAFSYGVNTLSAAETGGVGLRTVDNTNVHARSTATDWSATTLGANTATCTMSATVYPANGATFTFTPPLIPYTYLWSPTTFIPAGQELTQNPIATAVTVTTNYSITVTGNNGCTATVNNVIVTVAASANIVNQPVAVSECAGQNASFTVDVSGAELGYQWRHNYVDIPVAGNPSAGTETLNLSNITNLDNGIYDVVITSCGATLYSDGTSTLTVKTVPTAIPSSNAPICSGGNLLLTGTTDYGTIFSWSGPNGFTSGDQNPSISSVDYTTESGVYSFTATLNGCSRTGTTNVLINPTPEFTIDPSAATIQPGDIQQLTIISLNNYLKNYDNGPIITSIGTGAGGLDESWLFSPLTNYGYGIQYSASNAVADDFTVTGGSWDISSMEFLGYQTSSGTTSSITGIYVQVWNGLPGAVTSTVVWGDMTTNRMTSTSFASIYRVNVAQNADRPVMKIIANTTGLSLLPGNYWIEISADGSASYTGPWVPPITITGTNNTGNGMQRTGTNWSQILDGTYTVGIPFIVNGTITGSTTSVTWSPVADLFTDPGATPGNEYTGTPATTVWSKPAATVTYTATAATTVPCTSSQDVTITVAPTTKTLTVTAFLEGLYNGAGGLYEAQGLAGPEFPGYADQVTVELHNSVNYATIEYTSGPVNLNTAGIVTVNDIPSGLTGSYYITIKHRSSIETTSAAPVSFAIGPVSYDFTTASSQAYGDNMRLMGTVYAIWGGDVNLDGLVDSGDMNFVENASTAITFGYVVEDVNGDGLVDSGDMNMVENNSVNIVGVVTP